MCSLLSNFCIFKEDMDINKLAVNTITFVHNRNLTYSILKQYAVAAGINFSTSDYWALCFYMRIPPNVPQMC